MAGYFFFFGKALVSWSSKKQFMVTFSTCEAKYIVVSDATCQVAWLRSLISELQIGDTKTTKLMVDNKSVVDLVRHLTCHGKSKHINIRFNFLCEQVNLEKLKLEYYKSEVQLSYLFTKVLKYVRFKLLIFMLDLNN